MRAKLIFIQVLFITLSSCKKEEGSFNTSFQFYCTDHLTGDTLPNVQFYIAGGFHGDNDFISQTNEYGNFDTAFTHTSNTDFNIGIYDQTKYMTVQESGDIIGGTHTVAVIDVMSMSKLKYVLDCSGSGHIQNIRHERLIPVPVNYQYYAQAKNSAFDFVCNGNPEFDLFSGDWVISYEYRPTNFGTWEELKDTVSLVPGQELTYTIAE